MKNFAFICPSMPLNFPWNFWTHIIELYITMTHIDNKISEIYANIFIIKLLVTNYRKILQKYCKISIFSLSTPSQHRVLFLFWSQPAKHWPRGHVAPAYTRAIQTSLVLPCCPWLFSNHMHFNFQSTMRSVSTPHSTKAASTYQTPF